MAHMIVTLSSGSTSKATQEPELLEGGNLQDDGWVFF